MVLLGPEVKSLRAGKANLGDAYAEIRRGEVYLLNAHIGAYEQAGRANAPPRRERKLLLHQYEISRLVGRVVERGLTLIPLQLYFKDGRAKVELALARGKRRYDKRQAIRKRENERDLKRIMRGRGRSRVAGRNSRLASSRSYRARPVVRSPAHRVGLFLHSSGELCAVFGRFSPLGQRGRPDRAVPSRGEESSSMNLTTAKFLMIPVLIVGGLYGIRNFTGEVATLYTTDGDGKTHTSRIWVVDHGHQVWVRSLDPTSPWLDRLINQPDVQLRRGESIVDYRATPFANRRTRINSLMAERYGWVEWFLSKIEEPRRLGSGIPGSFGLNCNLTGRISWARPCDGSPRSVRQAGAAGSRKPVCLTVTCSKFARRQISGFVSTVRRARLAPFRPGLATPSVVTTLSGSGAIGFDGWSKASAACRHRHSCR